MLLRVGSFARRGFAAGREKGSYDKADTPAGGAERSFGINLCAERELDRLFSDLCQLTHHKIDRDGPLIVMPVVGAFRV
jgi:hypothetical protein